MTGVQTCALPIYANQDQRDIPNLAEIAKVIGAQGDRIRKADLARVFAAVARTAVAGEEVTK